MLLKPSPNDWLMYTAKTDTRGNISGAVAAGD